MNNVYVLCQYDQVDGLKYDDLKVLCKIYASDPLNAVELLIPHLEELFRSDTQDTILDMFSCFTKLFQTKSEKPFTKDEWKTIKEWSSQNIDKLVRNLRSISRRRFNSCLLVEDSLIFSALEDHIQGYNNCLLISRSSCN